MRNIIAAGLIALFAALTGSVVSGNRPIAVPVSLREHKLVGSVFIGKQAFDMTFGMSSDDSWVFGKDLRQDQLQESQSFSHHFYTKSDSLTLNTVDSYFESAEFNHNKRGEEFIITGKTAFEDISFHKDSKANSLKKTIPIGIVDNIKRPMEGVSFDYDGMFGLWPWKDDTPECPMSAWGKNKEEAYTAQCLILFAQKKASYFDNLPKMQFSLHLPDSGDSGELVLGGYDVNKINGPLGCAPISRFRASGSGSGWHHTFVSVSTPVFYGRAHLTAERKRKPIRDVLIDVEVSGLQVPLSTLQNIMKKAGVKKMSFMPSIGEESAQHNAANEKDEGYFIPCSRRNKVTHIGFFMGKRTRVSLTGHDMFIPSEANPRWCKMVINPLPRAMSNHPMLVLGDIFFKKYVTIFDFERGRGKTTMCVGTPKDAADRGEEDGGITTKTGSSSRAARLTLFSASNSTGYYDNHLAGGGVVDDELLNTSSGYY